MMSRKSLGVFGALLVSVVVAAFAGDASANPSPRQPSVVPQPGTIQFAGAVSVDERAGTAQLMITRTAGSDGVVSVTVMSRDGSARAGEDYITFQRTVGFRDGDAAAKIVTVPIIDDAQVEADETFAVSLLSPTGGAKLGELSTAIVTIRDNEPAPTEPPAAPTVTVSAAIKQLTFTWASVPGAASYRLFQNPDGASGFTQVGADYPGDALSASIEIAVHRHDWVNALYRVESCNANGCSGSISISTVDAMVQTIGYFKASNTGPFDQFGTAVALSADGRTLAVGAPSEDSNAIGVGSDQGNNAAIEAGAVYVFTRAGTQWSQQAYLKASNTGADDRFGRALALSADGSMLAVGAPNEDSNAVGVGSDQGNNAAADAGAVYVFTRAGTLWSQQAYVKASNTNLGDEFGWTLALSADGGTLAVGAIAEDSAATGVNGDQNSNAAFFAGAVYVFTRDGTQWSQQAYVKASNTAQGDGFGEVVALSADGGTLAVGATGEDSAAIGVGNGQDNNAATDAGAVYVFTRDGAQWSQQAYVKASNTDAGDQFAEAVALSADGGTLAVGALFEASNATGVGSDQSNNDATGAGAAYVFTRAGTQWSQQVYVKASNTRQFDFFGISVALSADGSTLAVGAHQEDSSATGVGGDQVNDDTFGAGAAYVFTRDGTQWSQRVYVKAPNTGIDDLFGFALSLDAGGGTLAVGGLGEDGNATGVGNDQDNDNDAAPSAGAVYVY